MSLLTVFFFSYKMYNVYLNHVSGAKTTSKPFASNWKPRLKPTFREPVTSVMEVQHPTTSSNWIGFSYPWWKDKSAIIS